VRVGEGIGDIFFLLSLILFFLLFFPNASLLTVDAVCGGRGFIYSMTSGWIRGHVCTRLSVRSCPGIFYTVLKKIFT
jgi:hypothetical protein